MTNLSNVEMKFMKIFHRKKLKICPRQATNLNNWLILFRLIFFLCVHHSSSAYKFHYSLRNIYITPLHNNIILINWYSAAFSRLCEDVINTQGLWIILSKESNSNDDVKNKTSCSHFMITKFKCNKVGVWNAVCCVYKGK